ncbi:alpha-tocopherol transfer protein-like [Trichoplusia ni]|uniref:Alpha-tocopherol transfer protein-like n=1 Tax=Trichoplusia ni TaxID=7111 RepID=A0A7E5WJ10_TRINI|nr:alpha-tocopherol transfer protein-like [Trichoplusia ni]
MALVKPISIEKEYEKNPDITPDDVRKLREWLKTQPHLPGEHISDVDLLIVFHCCEKSIEVTKQVLDLHFTLRTLFVPFFKDRILDKKMDAVLNTILFAPLPTPTAEGHRVVYVRLLDPDPRSFNLVEGVKLFMMMFDLCQYEEGTWPGFVLIIDMDQTCLSHVTRLEVMSLKKVLYFLQECMFTKLKGVHFMNAPYFMDKLMMVLKPFLKKELVHVVNIHPAGTDSIYSLIPKEAFPKEDGGNYKDRKTINDELYQRLQANSEFFRAEAKRRVNESLRSAGKPSPAEKEFGLQGSFKKLDLD